MLSYQELPEVCTSKQSKILVSPSEVLFCTGLDVYPLRFT